MNIVDWVIIGALVVFAWSGWRQGFIAGILSFVGFLGGGLVAAYIVPRVVNTFATPGLWEAIIVATVVLAAALLGQALVGGLGRRLRGRITWRPAQAVDHVGGAALNVLALVVVLWIIASSIALLPDVAFTRSIRESTVLSTVDRAVPDPARNLFSGIRKAFESSDFPRVFAGIGEAAGPEVAAPDDRVLRRPAVRATWKSIVRVSGPAPECTTEVTGSGFVIAADYVMTNAHVLAGVSDPSVSIPGFITSRSAEVVYFDSAIDVAVLHVPGLDAVPLQFSDVVASTGDPAVVAGFPGGGPLDASAARVRALIEARGEDIYGQAGVVRSVYSLRGSVIPGNSGGPLLSPDGKVYGVVFASGLGDPTTGYALTAEQVAPAVAASSGATAVLDTGSCRTR
ncbi:MAG: MarP family serine protease [Actinobacteria bacterium]|nr:MarP family serine protease [Actinomycetota bacterium]